MREIISDEVADYLRKSPHTILGKDELREIRDLEKTLMSKSLCKVASEADWPLIGQLRAVCDPPTKVMTGICLGKDVAEKELWLQLGPSLEAVFAVELAAQVARHFSASLEIWLPTQEYAHTAAGDTSLRPELEFQVASEAERRIKAAFPEASVCNTARAEDRAKIYSRIDLTFARAFPERVPCPYGNLSAGLWDQNAFLATIAMMIWSVDQQRVLAVLDHDQLRPAKWASHLALKDFNAWFYWPPPHLQWRKPKDDAQPGTVLRRIQSDPRRMFRCATTRGKIFLEDTESSIRARIGGQDEDLPALAELAHYAEFPGHASLTGLASVANLAEAVCRRKRAWDHQG